MNFPCLCCCKCVVCSQMKLWLFAEWRLIVIFAIKMGSIVILFQLFLRSIFYLGRIYRHKRAISFHAGMDDSLISNKNETMSYFHWTYILTHPVASAMLPPSLHEEGERPPADFGVSYYKI